MGNKTFQATIFANGNGVPPTTGVNIVYNASLGGAKLDLLAISPSTGNADLALDGAIYHPTWWRPRHRYRRRADRRHESASDRVREGVEAVKLTSFLKN